jgi:HSP20 family protein
MLAHHQHEADSLSLLRRLPPAPFKPCTLNLRSKEDVKIKVLDNTLTISGERKEEKKEGETKEGKSTRIERSYGSFVRSFSLPQNVDAGGIKAAAKDGVLTVVIPKVEQQKPEATEIAIE